MHTIYYVGQHKLSMVLSATSNCGNLDGQKIILKCIFIGPGDIYNLRSFIYYDSM